MAEKMEEEEKKKRKKKKKKKKKKEKERKNGVSQASRRGKDSKISHLKTNEK